MKIVPKDFFFPSCPPPSLFTKTMGVYIGHPLYENTRKPNILANTRDKEVIHQNEVGWHYLHKDDKAGDFAMQYNFAR